MRSKRLPSDMNSKTKKSCDDSSLINSLMLTTFSCSDIDLSASISLRFIHCFHECTLRFNLFTATYKIVTFHNDLKEACQLVSTYSQKLLKIMDYGSIHGKLFTYRFTIFFIVRFVNRPIGAVSNL